MRHTKALHHRGSYHVRSRRVVAQAWLNPDTRCWRCGLTHDEYAAVHGARAARWTAGHLIDGQIDGDLAPEHTRCNSSAGATAGNRRRTRNRTSRNW